MKAIALISGGLDSTLATKLIKEQGVEIIALNFKTPFCLCDRRISSGCLNYSRQVANNLGIELKVINISDEFFRVVENPKHGYGSNMNPCIDCRILKFRKAKEFMQEIGASFLVTGEVLGQRPMSQHRQALNIIDQESQLEGLVLRPLSAKLLPETIPEREGWVSRDKLLNFSGRTRRPQIALAKKFNLKDYACPAGGCLLTDPEFAKKLRELIRHQEFNKDNVELLKLGRHFRLAPETKLVVGRNEEENKRLINLVGEGDYLFMPKDIAGPTSLGRGAFNEELIKLASSITCRYCDLNGNSIANIIYKRIPKQEKILQVPATDETKLQALRI
ncbi:MAG: 7-cyano-7-deazaguanine synthase [Candidatus Omnitrophica bacterium]|nr:7-cyano-7-deazaguanine synthase [Candidatus Omnitrophota bacterium]